MTMQRGFNGIARAVMFFVGGIATTAQTTAPPAGPTQTAPLALPDSPLPVAGAPQSHPVATEDPSAPAPALIPFAGAGKIVQSGQQITILEDTMIRVMTSEPIDSKHARSGTPVLCFVSEDVLVNDVLAIPRGATVRGEVIRSKRAGRLTGSPELIIKLVSLDLGGRTYPLYTYLFKMTGASKTEPTEKKAMRGAAVGAIAGALASGVSSKGGVEEADGLGRAASMGTGAAVGAGVGTAISAATPGPGIRIPSEAQVDFYLAAPITVAKVSEKEAARLAEGLHSGGPSLYLRGEAP
ncbi:MAG: hypothetical protein ABSE46_21430 [Terracidiphilus sp.]|jgi:hypothetical protein